MCIMDGADFEPYWMTNRCDLILDERESAEFWVRSRFQPLWIVVQNYPPECSRG